MGRRKIKRRRTTSSNYSLSKKLNAEVKKGIFIVFVFGIGIISLLGLFGSAGKAGLYLTQLSTLLFGWGRWFVPFILLALSLLNFNKNKYNIRTNNYLGFLLFFSCLHTIFHFFFPFKEWASAIDGGNGGGYFGYLLALGFYNFLGVGGSLVILLCLLFVSWMLIFEISLHKIINIKNPFAFIFNKIKSRKENNEEEYEDDDEEDPIQKEIEEKNKDTQPKLELIKNIENKEKEEIKKIPEKKPNIEDLFTSKKISEKKEEERPKKELKKTKEKKQIQNDNVKIDLPFDLLSDKSTQAQSGNIEENALIIQKTLKNFNINVTMGDTSVGPTVTQYTFKPAEGVKLSKITTLNNDLALALAAHPIRIEAPIPGQSLVGIEVPNPSKAMVRLRENLDNFDFKNRKTNTLIAIGKDVAGKTLLYDLTKCPHLLVAGATNSGKSVCLNAIILSLLYQNNPSDLRFIMVDPKRVELPVYNDIPHLLCPVITDVDKTINALRWCLNEMDRRFEVLSKYKKRNIKSYNESDCSKGEDGKMPYLIFIIDELADLMVVAAKDIESSIIRLAQMARAVGIHLILATQRPSVDVITGLIKANTPARIAFSVSSGIDSKTILDSLGAEKLLGQGDMLFTTPDIAEPKRLQGAFVSDDEIKNITDYIKERSEPNYIDEIVQRQKVSGMASHGLNNDSEDESGGDELFYEAKDTIVNMGKASASLLQRKLSIGYARAARLIDLLEDAGVVGPANGSKPREILISETDYAREQEVGVSGVSLHKMEEATPPESYLDDAEDDTPLIFKTNDNEEKVDEKINDDDNAENKNIREENTTPESEEIDDIDNEENQAKEDEKENEDNKMDEEETRENLDLPNDEVEKEVNDNENNSENKNEENTYENNIYEDKLFSK